jgi:hypothetical protein
MPLAIVAEQQRLYRARGHLPRTFDAPRSTFRFYAAPMPEAVRLDASNPKWIQLCAVGSYVYRGQPVDITEALFDEMIANFRAHPAFDAGARSIFGKPLDDAAKLGAAITSGVIALNFDHPPHGAPRPGHGWFLDVERRGGELWGLCWFDAEAHAGLVAGRWKWTSIEWSGDTVNNRGEEIGPYLSGVALTNDPFITGMTPIQMSARGVPVVWFGPATDVLCELRCVFALPETADVGAVIGEVAKLRAWALGQAAPPIGVDVAGLVGRVRAMLNLPTLTEAANIFAELDKLLGALADEQEKEIPMPPTETIPTPPAAGLARLFASRLSAMSRTVVQEDEQSLVRAFDGMSSRYEQLSSAMAAIEGLFGTADPKALADKIAAFAALKDQMSQILGETTADNEAGEKEDAAMAAADVEQVMQAQRIDPARAPGTVQAYTAQRLGFASPLVAPSPEEVAKDPAKLVKFRAEVRKRREDRATARTSFFKAHGIEQTLAVPAALQHLSGPAFFAGNGALFGLGNGAPQGQAGQGYQGANLGAPPAPQGQGNAWTFGRVQNLPPGPNDAERIFAEVVRSELGGRHPAPGTQAYTDAWARVSQIMANIQRQPSAGW